MLTIRDLTLTYGGAVRALRRVDLQVDAGSVVALLGSNGAGKTSVLRAVSGNLRRHRATITGTIELDGSSLDGVDAAARVRRGLVQVPEGRRIFTGLTIRENLLMGGTVTPARRRGAALDAALDLFPVLRERRDQPAGVLSGGEQQMLAIGRAMMADPKVLMLDEPSLGLAPKTVALIAQTIAEINGTGTSVLLIEQNATMALALAQHAYVLELGRVAIDGPTSDERLLHQVSDLYLGAGAGPAATRTSAHSTLSRWAG